jgi:hypothetical protein
MVVLCRYLASWWVGEPVALTMGLREHQVCGFWGDCIRQAFRCLLESGVSVFPLGWRIVGSVSLH